MRFFLRNKKGQSLVQTLISVGIIAVLATVMASLISNMMKESKYLSQKLESLDVEKLLISVLADGSVCTSVVSSGDYRINSNSLNGQTIPLPNIPSSAAAGAQPVVGPNMNFEHGMTVDALRFANITAAGGNQFLADIEVTWQQANLARGIKPVRIRQILTPDPMTPANSRRITTCSPTSSPPVGGLGNPSLEGERTGYNGGGPVALGRHRACFLTR